MKQTVLVTIVLCAAVWAFQGKRPIPKFPGDGNPDHDGQPEFCINSDTDKYRANCACKRDCKDHDQDAHRESECKTFCRTPRCLCDHGCDMTE